MEVVVTKEVWRSCASKQAALCNRSTEMKYCTFTLVTFQWYVKSTVSELVKWKKSTRWWTSKASRLTNVIEMEIVSYFHNFWCRFWRDSSTNFWRDFGAFLARFLYRFWIKSLRAEEKPTITEPTSKKTTLPHVSDEQRSTLDRFFQYRFSVSILLYAQV